MLDIVDPLTEEPITNNELLAGRCVLVRPLMLDWGYDFDQEQTHMEVTSEKSANPDMNEEFVVSATVPFTVQQDESVDSAGIVTVDESEEVEALMDGKDGIQHDPLEALTPKEFVQLRMPVLTSLQAVTSMTKPQMGANIRLKGLEVQHDLWADDEIRWHVGKILEQAGNPTKVCLDPLIATAVVSSGNAGLIYQWIRSQKVNPSMIVTAVLHDGHWVPIVWTWTSECTTAHSWDVQRQVPNFNVLHDAIAKAVGSRTYILDAHYASQFRTILLMEEILHRRGHIGQYGYDFYPRTPCSMLCSQALCAGAGFQSFNFFAFMTNFSYQC